MPRTTKAPQTIKELRDEPRTATLAERLTLEHAQIVEEAERILRQDVKGTKAMSFDDRLMLGRDLGWDDKRIERELGRMGQVLKCEEAAGNATTRKARAKAVDDAKANLAENGDALLADIEAIQAKHDALVNAVNVSHGELEAQEQAIERLRELAPEDVKDRVAQAEAIVKRAINPELLPVRGELDLVANLEAIDPGSYAGREAALLHCRTVGRSNHPLADLAANAIREAQGAPASVDAVAFGVYVNARKTASKPFAVKLDELENKRAEMLAEARAPLDHYLRNLR